MPNSTALSLVVIAAAAVIAPLIAELLRRWRIPSVLFELLLGIIIGPAVLELQHNGMDIEGPFSADTAFHLPNWARYDAVITMYHDQALIPVKTLDFHGGVNVTLGLPFIRTSPDHGTALGIAGTGKANPQSLIAALTLAGEMAAHVRR